MKYIIANWKMNPSSLKQAEAFFLDIESGLKNANLNYKEVIICPPYLYLFHILNFKFQILNFGAQNCFWEDKGAFTGEISPAQLKEIGANYVILGHSERRKELSENYEMVSKKIFAAIRNDLTPILCFGSNNIYIEQEKQEIKEQIKTVFTNLISLNNLSGKIIIAYEPVWAISGNKNSAPANAKRASEMIDFIKNILINYKIEAKSYIYGGSVDSKNARSFMNQYNISGVLVGGASLNTKEFLEIIKN